jgi:threonylcarbamoyladenosine tRNA methylthiotransferase MtaB
MATVAIATLGCKVNQFESEALMASLEERGYSLVPFGEGADITIINTCTVTQRADFQSRQMVRRALRYNPNSLVIVTGCYSQVAPETIAKMSGVQYILGNAEKARIPDLLPLMQKVELPQIQVGDIQKETFFSDIPLHSFHRHTRAFLKIQEGCDARCSYCIVPYARGRSRSLSSERVIEHLRVLKERDFKEVVLTGIHLGSYGLDLTPPFPLEKLLRRLEEEETPHRIRLSSIEPLDFSADLKSFLSQSKKVCPHLHIPVQSGDDEILKRMNRNYDRSFLFDLIQELHRRIPKLSIGADVIVGFPGETEEKFRKTYELIESLPFSYLHIFPFSKRKGTPASQFPHGVDVGKIKKRAEILRDLGKQKRQSFYRQFLLQELNVLVEDRKEKETGRWKGFSRNYIPVLITPKNGAEGSSECINQECAVKVTDVTEKGLVGQVVER